MKEERNMSKKLSLICIVSLLMGSAAFAQVAKGVVTRGSTVLIKDLERETGRTNKEVERALIEALRSRGVSKDVLERIGLGKEVDLSGVKGLERSGAVDLLRRSLVDGIGKRPADRPSVATDAAREAVAADMEGGAPVARVALTPKEVAAAANVDKVLGGTEFSRILAEATPSHRKSLINFGKTVAGRVNKGEIPIVDATDLIRGAEAGILDRGAKEACLSFKAKAVSNLSGLVRAALEAGKSVKERVAAMVTRAMAMFSEKRAEARSRLCALAESCKMFAAPIQQQACAVARSL